MSLQIGGSEIFIVAGKPLSGKSHFIKYLLMHLHPKFSNDPIKYMVVFTTTKFNGKYEEFLPAEYVHPRYDPGVLESLVRIQIETAAKSRAAVIFDDCLDARAFSSQLFLQLCTTFRHLRIDIIIASQYIYKVPPVVRECATRVAIFRQTTRRSLDALFESFGAWFNNLKEFQEYVLRATGNYGFIYYLANSAEESIPQVYKILKCPEEIPQFKYCF